MPEFSGELKKMRVVHEEPVDYFFRLGLLEVPMNPLIGREITLTHTGKIDCIGCGRTIKKSYQQGYCFPCTQTLAECDMCILRPERCHYHLGTCRQPSWGEKHCMQGHYVYLANSSGLKVGITRQTQLPTRWIDQGATQALPILRVSSRLQSGLFETAIKQDMGDRTDWRKMLRGEAESLDLESIRDQVFEEQADCFDSIASQFGRDAFEILEEEPVRGFTFPVQNYPDKIRSLNLDKTPRIEGVLQGIKGQYLIFDTGVINIRKYTGYEVALSYA